MSTKPKIFIAGAGGIGTATGILLREFGDLKPDLFIGDINPDAAKKAAELILRDSAGAGKVTAVKMPEKGGKEMDQALAASDLLLDCLPGSLAPKMARLAIRHNLHYANLTEYVAETEEIVEISKNASTGFILQTGLAPGYVCVLAHGLFRDFCRDYKVDKVDRVGMKVGALTAHAMPPHYYGFTWSPVGVATEYVKPAFAVREGQVIRIPSLTEPEYLRLDGQAYEADLTSGGAADLPTALAGKVESLDYKTIRYPGHYDWVRNLLHHCPPESDPGAFLEGQMLQAIPSVEKDLILVYAAVQGKDFQGKLRRREVFRKIHPLELSGKTLRAIQATTAAGLCESAGLLLKGDLKGPVFQSQIDPEAFLNGPFIKAIYG